MEKKSGITRYLSIAVIIGAVGATIALILRSRLFVSRGHAFLMFYLLGPIMGYIAKVLFASGILLKQKGKGFQKEMVFASIDIIISQCLMLSSQLLISDHDYLDNLLVVGNILVILIAAVYLLYWCGLAGKAHLIIASFVLIVQSVAQLVILGIKNGRAGRAEALVVNIGPVLVALTAFYMDIRYVSRDLDAPILCDVQHFLFRLP